MPPVATHVLVGGHPILRLGYGAALRLDGRAGTALPPNRQDMARMVMRRAVALGVGLIDTADSYGPAQSEALLAQALYPYPRGLMIATKGGVEVGHNGERRLNGQPSHLRQACEASLTRLRVDAIDLYQLHWPDPMVPLADQAGTLADLLAAGKIRHAGLCNVSVEQATTAAQIVPLTAIQGRFGIADPQQRPMLDWCAAHGAAFIAYGPLAVLQSMPVALAERKAENSAAHASVGRAVMALSARLAITPAQVALAWLLRQAPHVIAIPGTTSPRHLDENMAAAALAAQWPELDELTVFARNTAS